MYALAVANPPVSVLTSPPAISTLPSTRTVAVNLAMGTGRGASFCQLPAAGAVPPPAVTAVSVGVARADALGRGVGEAVRDTDALGRPTPGVERSRRLPATSVATSAIASSAATIASSCGARLAPPPRGALVAAWTA